MSKSTQNQESAGKLYSERAPASPQINPDNGQTTEAEAETEASVATRQRLQTQYGRSEVDMALSGESTSPFGTYVLAEYAMGASGLGSLTDTSPHSAAGMAEMLHSPEWATAAAGIVSRYAASEEPVHSHLAVELIRRSHGQKLPAEVAARLSQVLGVDISKTVIHTDGAADQAAKALNAHAFATGNDVFFASGQYQPGTKAGDELLAHELTHVIQDDQGRIPHATGGGLAVSTPDQAHEKEAERVGREAARQLHAPPTSSNVSLEGEGLLDSREPTSDFTDSSMALDIAVADTPQISAVNPSEASVVHRSADNADPYLYGEDGQPRKSERQALSKTMPEDLWLFMCDLEIYYKDDVFPSLTSAIPLISRAALTVKEDYFDPVFAQLDDRLLAIDEMEMTAEEEAYAHDEDVEESQTEPPSNERDDVFEQENGDLRADYIRAEASWDWLKCHQDLVSIQFFKSLSNLIDIVGTLSADSVLNLHRRSAERANQKLIAAQDLMDSFVQDVLWTVLQEELKDKAKELGITAIMTALVGPLGLAPRVAKGVIWFGTEVGKVALDAALSDGKPKELDATRYVDMSEKTTGWAVDVNKHITDSEELTGSWGEVEKLNKGLKGALIVLKVEKEALKRLKAIALALDNADEAMKEVEAAWPDALAKYKEIMGIVDKMKSAAPEAERKWLDTCTHINELYKVMIS